MHTMKSLSGDKLFQRGSKYHGGPNIPLQLSNALLYNRQSMTSESHIASIGYRATIVVRSFICECDVALEWYHTSMHTMYTECY